MGAPEDEKNPNGTPKASSMKPGMDDDDEDDDDDSEEDSDEDFDPNVSHSDGSESELRALKRKRGASLNGTIASV